MLQLSSYFLDKPVLSLRTGGEIATIIAPIINPRNLRIEGFYCEDSMDKETLILLCQDIREISRRGFIVDDHDVLVTEEDLIRLRDVLEMAFELIKKPVETVSKTKVGKVHDYAVDTSSMYIHKIYVSQPIWKNLAGGELSIDRTQIIEITRRKIIIQELLRPTPSAATAVAA